MDRNIINKVIIGFVVYSLLLLFIGRNLSFIPQIKFGGAKVTQATAVDDIRKNVLEKFLKTQKGSYSVYYKNLTTGESFGVEENTVRTAASLNKLPIVAYLYNQAARNRQDLEDEIVVQEDDIQDYGTGSIRYAGPGGSYSLKTLTKLAMEQSDNTAAHVLGLRLGTENIQEYAKSLGMDATDMENNKTSAADMGKVLEALWYGKVTKKALKLELLGFMKDTDFEDRLARNIPKNVSVYHKAADGVGFVHDAGIIDPSAGSGQVKGDPFVLVVMTSEIGDQEKAKAQIGKIAEFIYKNQN